MAARRAAAAGEELESRHADALGQEMRRGSLPGHAAAHSALADVTAGGPYLDDTVEMLGKVEKQAQELAGSVDTMLSTLATKMGDIAQTSKQHSVMWAPPPRCQPPSLLLPSRARSDALPVLALTRASARRFDNLVSGTEHQAEFAVQTLPCPPVLSSALPSTGPPLPLTRAPCCADHPNGLPHLEVSTPRHGAGARRRHGRRNPGALSSPPQPPPMPVEKTSRPAPGASMAVMWRLMR